MKKSNFSRYCMILTITLTSCGYNDGNWGATVGDSDEICTIYYTAQRELMENRDLYDRDFPNKEQRRKHVIEINNGHQINSWFIVVNENKDTTRNEFSCEVYYDNEKIGYVVKNLKIKN